LEADMAENGYNLSDIAAATGDGMGNNALVLILLFAMIFGGGGLGFGNNAAALGYENLATSAEVQRGFDAQNSMANEREILAAVNGTALQGVQNAKQNTQYMIGMLNDKYGELARDIAGVAVGQANILANQNECCCSTKMLISESAAQQRYDSAMQAAAIQQAIHAEGEQTRAMIQQDKIEALQQQVQQLSLAQAMNGVVRYPNTWAYNAGTSPFCQCGGGCGSI
jgi:hypothetical protein